MVALPLDRMRGCMCEGYQHSVPARILGWKRLFLRSASCAGVFEASEGCDSCVAYMVDLGCGEDWLARWRNVLLGEEVEPMSLEPCLLDRAAPVVEVGDKIWVTASLVWLRRW